MDNKVGAFGAESMGRALMKNTTITKINISSKQWVLRAMCVRGVAELCFK